MHQASLLDNLLYENPELFLQPMPASRAELMKHHENKLGKRLGWGSVCSKGPQSVNCLSQLWRTVLHLAFGNHQASFYACRTHFVNKWAVGFLSNIFFQNTSFLTDCFMSWRILYLQSEIKLYFRHMHSIWWNAGKQLCLILDLVFSIEGTMFNTIYLQQHLLVAP